MTVAFHMDDAEQYNAVAPELTKISATLRAMRGHEATTGPGDA